MTTFAQLTDRVLQILQGDSLDQTEQTHITEAVTSSDVSLTVDDPVMVSQGLAELGHELVWVTEVNRTTGVVTLAPYGRGYRSTNASSHDAGTALVAKPRYSRARVMNTINQSIESVYPDLYVLKQTTITYVAARLTYELPADCEQLHSLAWESVGPSRTWIPATQYRFDPRADTTAFDTGKSVDIWEAIVPGRTIRVTYITSPETLVGEDDVFSTTTGLDATAEEVIIYGTAYRMVGFLEPARLQVNSVESSARSELVTPGTAVNAGKFFYGLYLEALNNERERLLRVHGTSFHRTRRLL